MRAGENNRKIITLLPACLSFFLSLPVSFSLPFFLSVSLSLFFLTFFPYFVSFFFFLNVVSFVSLSLNFLEHASCVPSMSQSFLLHSVVNGWNIMHTLGLKSVNKLAIQAVYTIIHNWNGCGAYLQ